MKKNSHHQVVIGATITEPYAFYQLQFSFQKKYNQKQLIHNRIVKKKFMSNLKAVKVMEKTEPNLNQVQTKPNLNSKPLHVSAENNTPRE
jgi:hypothetical protein